jgi:hypothetical protein
MAMLLRIVLDSNPLYTDSASDLLSTAMKKLIEESRSVTDIQIEWLLPEIVRWEREYQMIGAGRALLANLKELDGLLGNTLGINDEIRTINDKNLSSRVRDAIDKQVRDLAITIIPLRVDAVDWQTLVLAAVFRHLPFEKGKKEKGFRDALIAECMMQVIADSPNTPASCRVALVTNDGLLFQAVKARTADSANVRVFRKLDDLQSHINTLVSHLTEDFVARIREDAERYFFSPDSKEGVLYKERVREVIGENYADKLAALPEGATMRENGEMVIDKPSFVTKCGQRITWRTSIAVQANAFTLQTSQPSLADFITGRFQSGSPSYPTAGSVQSGLFSLLETPQPSCTFGPARSGPVAGTIYSGWPGTTPVKILVATGHSLFRVTWSVSITGTGDLTDPKVESIDFIDNKWQGVIRTVSTNVGSLHF